MRTDYQYGKGVVGCQNRIEPEETMSKTQVSEKDRADLERLEQLVKDAGHAGIGTADLSKKSGIPALKIRSLFKDHHSRVTRGTDPDSKSQLPPDRWKYKPTPDDISDPHRAK